MTTIVPTARQARWILIGTALLLTLGMGMRQSFGLFLGPVTHDLALTASDFTLALAIQNMVWGFSQAFVGAIADRYGLRITMVAGAALYVIGLGSNPRHNGNDWALWWGMALACAFLAAATISFAIDAPPHDKFVYAVHVK